MDDLNRDTSIEAEVLDGIESDLAGVYDFAAETREYGIDADGRLYVDYASSRLNPADAAIARPAQGNARYLVHVTLEKIDALAHSEAARG